MGAARQWKLIEETIAERIYLSSTVVVVLNFYEVGF